MSDIQERVAEIPTFGEAARAAADAVRVASRKASVTMNQLGEEACETGVRARDEISRRVESQPLTSILLAAGVGLLAGLLWARQ